MKVEIIAVGTEVLMGDIVNTNAQYIARMLSMLGLGTYYHSAVGDNADRLKEMFRVGFERADIIITTGGLGPTKDDLTKEVASDFFNKELLLDQSSLGNIETYFTKLGRPLPENNKKQAYFPAGSHIVPNSCGTAPGCIIEENNKVLIMLPGPPGEMKPMFQNQIVPYLSKFSNGILVSTIIRMFGIGESSMEKIIEDIIQDQSNPTIAPYAQKGGLILRLTAWGESELEALEYMKPVKSQLYERLGQYIYGEGEKGLAALVCEALIQKNLTISVAESCTGGMLASTFIDYPGISQVLGESHITYSNIAKIKYLGVEEETLNKYGAVSLETAKEMADGVRRIAGSDIGISTTGIAGPDGGTDEKPVGLVYLGISFGNETYTYKLNMTGDRQKVRHMTTMWAFYHLLSLLK
ncbi:MAG TPA: competence/damage-inducible protein A [Epulopiscium sp.]|nr:competence/damage-inducible protein A [Candidatus Epulonipiscium sp.]